MATSMRRRAATAALATTATLSIGTALAPAAAAEDPYIPPMSCGVMHHELGALSLLVHGLEPILRPVRLEGSLHALNCAVVLEVEYLLGLQDRPGFPG